MKPLLLLFTFPLAALLACGPVYSQEPTADSDIADEASEEASSAPANSKFGNSFSTHNNAQLLSKDLPADQILWLDVAGEKVLSLYSPDHSGRARGGVILLPRHDQPITINNQLFNLQQTLADNRWHALTISMPSIKLTESGEDPSSQYIDTAITFLNDKGIYNMVILAEGMNAHRVLQFANQLTSKKQAKQIRGLAIVNPENMITPENLITPKADAVSGDMANSESAANLEASATPPKNNSTTPSIEELIPKLPFPILDIYFDESLLTKRNAKLRLRNSRSMPAKQYQQVRMLRLANNQKEHEDRLTKRVRGWLDKTAAGFSVGRKQ